MSNPVVATEKKGLMWFTGVTLSIISVPYLLGFQMARIHSAGDGWIYSGLLIAAEDGFSYLAKMLSGAHGAWLFRTPYTLEPQRGFIAYLPYLLLGKLTSPPGQYEQMVILYHLLRLTGVVLSIWAVDRFLSLFIEGAERKWALILIIFGGGLGYFSLLGLSGLWKGPMPLEFYSPETFGFLGSLAIAHLPWARGLLILGFARLLSGRRWQDAIIAGGMWFVMGFFQPLAIVSAWGALAGFLGILTLRIVFFHFHAWNEWKFWARQVALAGIISSPMVLYNFLSFQIDPFLYRWQAQNILPSPPPGDYLLAYGPVMLPVAFFLYRRWRELDVKMLFLCGWLAAFPFLAYVPYNLQRRLPEGTWVGLVVMGMLGIEMMKKGWKPFFYALVGSGLISTFLLVAGGIFSVLAPGRPLFIPESEVRAFRFLSDHIRPGVAVLASYETSTVLPAFVPVRVPIGHGPESLGLKNLLPTVNAFWSGRLNEKDRETFIKQGGYEYIFWGPLEQVPGGWNPAKDRYLEEVYSEGGYHIYRVGLLP
ncbi:hypothetical protein ATHL_01505 [Anaerolinea thermolimosa]|uniref:hypothetical protein n=1 Tax=Anaerolinea thermolimosa TaxID=229919 RepID=UPI000786060B|nr:hypothetical protein [Anaerolinea thermolimosa]GAP06649.1 hypothetical protein ATHL_01505 [Anaerolinea thermolimosa]